MPTPILRWHQRPSLLWFMVVFVVGIPLVMLAGPSATAQGRGGFGAGGGGAAAPAREAAPVDLTGYWVSLVTEDWIERMSPDSPPSGTGGGRGGFGRGGGAPQVVANPDEPCRVYGAAGSLRVPGRLHITWLDDSTLQLEMDAGTQTRVFHFDQAEPPPTESTLQGYSVATWETGGGGRGVARPQWGSLQVVTTNLTGGYLLSSRSSYSENTVVRENFITHSDFGAEYFTVSAVVEDGASTRVTSSTFKREPDGSRFSPTGCDISR